MYYNGLTVYCLSSLLCLLFVLMSQKYVKTVGVNGYKRERDVKIIPFSIAAAILMITVGFTDTGVDYYNYYTIIEDCTQFSDVYTHVNIEPLFTIFSVCINNITGNPHVVLFLLKTMSIAFFFYSFYLYRKEVSMFFLVAALISFLYLQSFYLISINIAASLVCCGFVKIVYQDKLRQGIIWFLTAVLFHYASLFSILTLVIYLLVLKGGHGRIRLSLSKQIIIIAIIFVGLSYVDVLMPYFIGTSMAFEHYEKYEFSQSSSIGLFHFFRYGVIFVMMAYWHKYKDMNLFLLTLCWGIVGFATTRMGLGIFGRLHFIFFPFFAFMPSFFVAMTKHKERSIYPLLIIVLLVYYSVNFYVSIQETMGAKSESEMTTYHLFNPFNAGAFF